MSLIITTKYQFERNIVIQELLDLIFPRHCVVCGDTLWGMHEVHLCVDCFYDLPLLDIRDTSMNNSLGKLFWGRCNFEYCWGWMEYRSGSRTSKIIKELKYKGNPDIAQFLGTLIGENLQEQEQLKKHEVILIPVPISPEKRKKRGYNQTEEIAKGISKVSGFAIEDRFLVRNIMRDSQTRMNRVSRFENMQGVFNINLEIFSELEQSRLNRLNPSILLLIVDDIVTTGATIETCYRAIANNLKVKIGVCSLGLTNK
jgi:ComF family protein